MHLQRQTLDQESHCLVYRLRIDLMVIIHDQDEAVWNSRDLVEQNHHDLFYRRWLRHPEHPQHFEAEIRIHRLQSGR